MKTFCGLICRMPPTRWPRSHPLTAKRSSVPSLACSASHILMVAQLLRKATQYHHSLVHTAGSNLNLRILVLKHRLPQRHHQHRLPQRHHHHNLRSILVLKQPQPHSELRSPVLRHRLLLQLRQLPQIARSSSAQQAGILGATPPQCYAKIRPAAGHGTSTPAATRATRMFQALWSPTVYVSTSKVAPVVTMHATAGFIQPHHSSHKPPPQILGFIQSSAVTAGFRMPSLQLSHGASATKRALCSA